MVKHRIEYWTEMSIKGTKMKYVVRQCQEVSRDVSTDVGWCSSSWNKGGFFEKERLGFFFYCFNYNGLNISFTVMFTTTDAHVCGCCVFLLVLHVFLWMFLAISVFLIMDNGGVVGTQTPWPLTTFCMEDSLSANTCYFLLLFFLKVWCYLLQLLATCRRNY